MPIRTPKPIAIQITSGVKGQPISIRNRTSGDMINETLVATGKHVIDLQNFTSGYTAGDIIDINLSGEVFGQGSLTTVGTKPQSIKVATTAILAAIIRGI